MDGLLLVDKPAGPTSHDVVARLRRSLGGVRTGHFGTLDPLATGLLIVALGQAVRVNRYYAGREKSYEGRLRLGWSTDTYDAEGIPTSVPSEHWPDRLSLENAVRARTGTFEQVPPPFSAKKVAGRPLYSYARKGRAVEGRPAVVSVREFTVRRFEPPWVDFFVRCSSGTYVRSLAHDTGRALGCGAYLASLRRTAIGEFEVASARPLEEVEQSLAGGRSGLLIPLEGLLGELAGARLDEPGAAWVRNGRVIPAALVTDDIPAGPRGADSAPEDIIRLFGPAGQLLALARRDPMSNSLTPFLVFAAS